MNTGSDKNDLSTSALIAIVVGGIAIVLLAMFLFSKLQLSSGVNEYFLLVIIGLVAAAFLFGVLKSFRNFDIQYTVLTPSGYTDYKGKLTDTTETQMRMRVATLTDTLFLYQ